MHFFFNDTATTEIYTLSLHDALPISGGYLHARTSSSASSRVRTFGASTPQAPASSTRDRKSTRLNSSHGYISYAVFCLKKKNSNICISQCTVRVLGQKFISRRSRHSP